MEPIRKFEIDAAIDAAYSATAAVVELRSRLVNLLERLRAGAPMEGGDFREMRARLMPPFVKFEHVMDDFYHAVDWTMNLRKPRQSRAQGAQNATQDHEGRSDSN